MKVLFETDRLIAREFLPTDAPLLMKLNDDKKVIQYTGDKAFVNEKQALSTIERNIIQRQYEQYGYGRWAVHLQSNGLFIGWCGFRKDPETCEVDLGFRYHKRFWNKGFATEMAQACLDYARENMQEKSIVGRVAKENLASIRVLEKIGMQLESETDCHGQEALLYRMEL